MADEPEEGSDPRTPLPISWIDAGEEANDLMDAPRMTRSTATPTTHGAMKNLPLDTTLTARSARSGDDALKNPDPATSDVVPTDPPPPPPKKSRITRPVIAGLVVAGLAIGAALVRLLVR